CISRKTQTYIRGLTVDRPSAKPTVLIENDRTIVTEWSFSVGAETGWHRHGYDYVVVPVVDGELLIEEGEGQSRVVELKTGEPYFRETGVEHNVVNNNPFDFRFIEVEYK
ncbi:MAG: cupin domain-containing protein, partial [Pseudomonadota bacterium]